jgi:hypothetical protein
LRRTLPITLFFGAFFAVCYGTTSWLAGTHATLPSWSFAFESRIPFIPSLSLVYLTITPALLLAPFVFRTRSALAPFAAALCIETLIASIFFLLLPQTTSFVRPPVTGWVRIPFTIADTLNLNFNQFPSLHVAFACSIAWAYRKTGWTLWSIAVALSTWLMWEHNLIDILGGVLLAFGVMHFVYPRLWVELCCLWQCAQFSRRHRRYFAIFVAIYGASLLHWKRYRAMRLGFCAAQWIDDLLDGDRASEREPLDVIDALTEEGGLIARHSLVRQTGPEANALARLTAAFFDEMPPAREDFLALVQTMRRDRVRVLGHERWSAAELDAHHRATFTLSVNLLLMTTRCAARANEVSALIDALAWCSTFRDLDDDLRKGLNNIPAEVTDVEEWSRTSRIAARETLRESAAQVACLADPRARTILGIFQRSIERFAARPLPRSSPPLPRRQYRWRPGRASGPDPSARGSA